jgi:hypothetical protein
MTRIWNVDTNILIGATAWLAALLAILAAFPLHGWQPRTFAVIGIWAVLALFWAIVMALRRFL